ncbi:MAG: hypothetical protein LBM95_04875 [Lactobacillales bacterium]|jgi:hypothetical protein|nr:hypothetical protein [Lactobacillales bacterium]
MQVFVVERTITMEEEFDASDDEEMIYVVIDDGKESVSTGRLQIDEGKFFVLFYEK